MANIFFCVPRFCCCTLCCVFLQISTIFSGSFGENGMLDIHKYSRYINTLCNMHVNVIVVHLIYCNVNFFE
uniref:Uncharacterized protein n=1 Tax=Ciona intestinalis TaxID=7719 RepID=H2XMI2_CIOIN